MELIQIPHLGLSKIAALHRILGITTRDELKAACEAGQVRRIRGFGERIEQRILAALTSQGSPPERILLSAALAAAKPLLNYLRRSPRIDRAELVGSVRRCEETVGNVDIVASSSVAQLAVDHFVRFPGSIAILSRDATGATIRLLSGTVAVLRAVEPQGYVAARHYFTGATAHIDKLRRRARLHGVPWHYPGWTDVRGTPVALGDEDELYRCLGLQPIPPELREDRGEIEAAASGTLPTDLIRIEDVRGILHVHTRYSDGKHSIEEMATAAQAMGMEYLTITDHSPSAVYARGVSLDRLRRQWDEIARVQQRVRIRLLRGTESDILRDGSLDYPDSFLEKFDVIIASIHARYQMDATAMTNRVLRALEHPVFKVWGHPLGQLLNRRPPFACDVERILDGIAESRAAIEINGDPHRLDLGPRWIRAARERSIPLVLSTDAHSIRGLDNLRFAVSTARRGWVRRGEALNTLSADEFCAAVRPRL